MISLPILRLWALGTLKTYFTRMGVVLQDIAVHVSASSVTVSTYAVSAPCFHLISIFGLTSTVYTYMENDSLPCNIFLSG